MNNRKSVMIFPKGKLVRKNMFDAVLQKTDGTIRSLSNEVLSSPFVSKEHADALVSLLDLRTKLMSEIDDCQREARQQWRETKL